MITVRGPFDLGQATRFLEGFAPAGVGGRGPDYVAAHVLNGRALRVSLAARPDGRLDLGLAGPSVAWPDRDAAARLVRRMFSLDWDGNDFHERVGRADPVMGELQQRFSGLRPVLFGSPFEALCWAVIGQRVRMTQAARLKTRLARTLGPTVTIEGEVHQAFPAPTDLIALTPDRGAELGLPRFKVERLLGLAERGARGDLDAERLLEMAPGAARAWLVESPGIGPWASELALIRGAGHPDLLPRGEPRLCASVRRYYGLEDGPTAEYVERLAERWAPYRSWAVFLLRVALQEETSQI